MPAHTDDLVPLARWRGTGQPVLDAGGLTLRPWAATDVDAVVRAYSDPAIRHWHVQDMTPDEAAAWIASWPARFDAGTRADWAVTEQDRVVGRIGMKGIDLFEGGAELAYWVLPEQRGRRVAPRAVDVLATWSFERIGLHRLTLRHSTRNAASCAVARHAGFDLEGTTRASGRHVDGWHDMHLHGRVSPLAS